MARKPILERSLRVCQSSMQKVAFWDHFHFSLASRALLLAAKFEENNKFQALYWDVQHFRFILIWISCIWEERQWSCERVRKKFHSGVKKEGSWLLVTIKKLLLLLVVDVNLQAIFYFWDKRKSPSWWHCDKFTINLSKFQFRVTQTWAFLLICSHFLLLPSSLMKSQAELHE